MDTVLLLYLENIWFLHSRSGVSKVPVCADVSSRQVFGVNKIGRLTSKTLEMCTLN